MTAKRMQNTHEKGQQLEWVKKSKMFHKCDASIYKRLQKVAKSYKNQNQINIFKKISIQVALK